MSFKDELTKIMPRNNKLECVKHKMKEAALNDLEYVDIPSELIDEEVLDYLRKEEIKTKHYFNAEPSYYYLEW